MLGFTQPQQNEWRLQYEWTGSSTIEQYMENQTDLCSIEVGDVWFGQS